MKAIDSHAHVRGDHPETLKLLETLGVKILGVCVPVANDDWRKNSAEVYKHLAAEHPDQYAWCTGCDLPDFQDAQYADRVIANLERDFAAGAVGVKVWKNIGMQIKDPQGRFVLIDDPIFEPIFAHLEKRGWPLLMHIAEPLACWQGPSPENRHYVLYYSQHPEWYMYTRPEAPSHAQLMAARDRVVERHPKLPVIGAHLASLEYDLKEIADRLERFANLAVDVSGRTPDLADHPQEQVRQFIERYQDRILWSTDLGAKLTSAMTPEARQKHHAWLESNYRREFAYYETDEIVRFHNREVRGLKLPERLLQKLYLRNAQQWFPGA